jgi:hypothetical protein
MGFMLLLSIAYREFRKQMCALLVFYLLRYFLPNISSLPLIYPIVFFSYIGRLGGAMKAARLCFFCRWSCLNRGVRPAARRQIASPIPYPMLEAHVRRVAVTLLFGYRTLPSPHGFHKLLIVADLSATLAKPAGQLLRNSRPLRVG